MIEIAVAFGVAKAAVAGVKEAIALGHEIQDCYRDIAKFFEVQGEIEAAVIEQKIAPTKNATAEALDAVFASRQMKKLEQELKEMLIYNSGNESGLYEEMCQRRSEIVQARKDAVEDAARAERMRIAAIRRAKEQKIQNIQEWCAVVLGVTISSFIMWIVWWMFKHGGKN